MADEDSVGERLAAMVRDIANQMSGRDSWGWKAKLADCLGVSPSYVSKLLGEDPPNVTHETAGRIAARIGLRWLYFDTAHDLGTSTWRDYLRPAHQGKARIENLDHAMAAFHGSKSGMGDLRRVLQELRAALEDLPVVRLARLVEAIEVQGRERLSLEELDARLAAVGAPEEPSRLERLIRSTHDELVRPLRQTFEQDRRVAFRQLVSIDDS